MTTTTTTTTATLNIIKALPRWVQSSLEINGTPDGWVPLDLLGMTEEEVHASYEANIIDIQDDTARFVEENVITIYNWLQ